MKSKVCVLLINLGSPKNLSKRAVRQYLKEFLSDPKVIDIHPILRFLLLELIILPFRTKKTFKAYESIWTTSGSPLLVNSKNFADKLASLFAKDDITVKIAMRYGTPSICETIAQINKEGFDQIIALPLYPHYAASSTGTALIELQNQLNQLWNVPSLLTLPAFYNHLGYINAISMLIKEHLPSDHHLVFSFHGLPLRHIAKSEGLKQAICTDDSPCPNISSNNQYCYRAQCFLSAKLISQQLGISNYSVSFQSRLEDSWIKPYTDLLLPELLKKGVDKVAIVCPSFVADCLETIEEIGIRAKKQWFEDGGKSFTLIPCLNDFDPWIHSVYKWIKTFIKS